jgi:hypothetical protein
LSFNIIKYDIEMPPPPNYDCPICKKGFQRGYLAKHLHTHLQKDLIKHVINKAEVHEERWHPSFDCSGHIYIICPHTNSGFEKDTRLHKTHKCDYSYSEWLKETDFIVQEIKKESDQENSTVESRIEDNETINEINMILPDDEYIETHNTNCNCHNEITQLKKELELLKIWRDLVLSSVPMEPVKTEPVKTEPVKTEPVKTEPVKTEPVEIESNENQKKDIMKPIVKSTTKSTKPKIQASKKEIEKGMWCKKCEACLTIAQFSTDLRPCGICKKHTHYNDDLTGCYHWECPVCSIQSCYTCVKSAGGNRCTPFCSSKCAISYKNRKE